MTGALRGRKASRTTKPRVYRRRPITARNRPRPGCPSESVHSILLVRAIRSERAMHSLFGPRRACNPHRDEASCWGCTLRADRSRSPDRHRRPPKYCPCADRAHRASLKTRAGRILAVPYPQELNDSSAIIGRRVSAGDFADMIVDQLEEMFAQSAAQSLTMGIALHPYCRPAFPATAFAPRARSSCQPTRQRLAHHLRRDRAALQRLLH